MQEWMIGAGAAAVAAAALSALAIRLVVVGRPDEWVLKIRNGRLITGGIGIVAFRFPWERIVRFTASMQRVAFSTSALSAEALPVTVQGFALWSVSAAEDGPFRAYSKLGIVDPRELPGRENLHQKHLLQKPQHKAFQLLVCALVERLAAQLPLRSLLSRPDDFVARVREQLVAEVRSMGIEIDDLQILHTRPTDPAFLRQLSAEIEERTREEASKRKLSADEEIEQRKVVLASKLEQEKIEAQKANEVRRARTALEIQEEKAALLEAQLEARRRELEHHHNLRILEEGQKQGLLLAQEENARALQEAAGRREKQALDAKLTEERERAKARHDVVTLLAQAEEAKSDAVRQHEIARLSVERMSEAFGKLPLKDAQWLTVGNHSPVETLAALFASWQALARRKGTP